MSLIHSFDSLESTNKTAKEMALTGAGHGVVVTAETQTGGRGRGAHLFYCAGGGIYMSVILQPEEPSQVTIRTAVSVCEAIESVCGKSPGIKWVNDLFLDGKKICGILAETVTDGALQKVVVGIGVNFSIENQSFPPELRDIAGSIFPNGTSIPREKLTEEIINRILTLCPWEDTLRAYRKRMLFLGEKIWVATPKGRYEAQILDIDGSGQLLVKKDDGQTRSLLSGEVSVKR